MTTDALERHDGNTELRRILADDGWRVGVASVGIVQTILAPKGTPTVLIACFVAIVT